MSYPVLAASCLALCACEHKPASEYEPVIGPTSSLARLSTEYRFGVEPMRPTRRLWHRFAPLMDTLNSHQPDFQVRLESALAYTEYRDRVHRAEYDFGLFEPHLVLDAETRGYRIFARVAAHDRIAGVVVVRSDSGIRRLRDLRGKPIAFGSPGALASTMLVRFWLREAGLRRRDERLLFAGSPESALLEVFAGSAAAAGASLVAWREFQQSHPEEAAELEVRWRTDDLPGPAVMAHKRVPPPHVKALAQLLATLPQLPGGANAIERTGFHGFRPAESGSYDEIWEFLSNYSVVIGRGRQ